MRNLLFLFTALFVLACQPSITETNKPFPQNIKYSYGYQPATISYQEAQNTYNKWKELYLVKCKDNYRIACDYPEETKVEVIGFGTILTAYFGDKTEFDGLYNFYKLKRTANANNMMAWNVTCDSINDPGSASDGDIDVAYALIVAYNQWGGNYLEEAKSVIQVIKNSVITSCDSLLAVAPGYSKESKDGPMWGGCQLTDIQYYTPAFFRLFAEVTGDDDWNKLADDTYTILNAAADSNTGLVPDWQSVSGKPGGNSDRYSFFRYDACRVPWRMALDYLWNGNEEARRWCFKVSDWAYSIGPANIKDGYNLDGTDKNDGYHNSAFTGGFAVSALCNSQAVADSFAAEMANGKLGDDHWFMKSTRALYLLTITGNFWKPVVPEK